MVTLQMSDHGQILSSFEEFTHLKCFVQKTWHDEDSAPSRFPLGIQLSCKTLQTFTLQHRLQHGLQAFPFKDCEPGSARKGAAVNLCGLVFTTITIQQRMFMQDHSHVTHR